MLNSYICVTHMTTLSLTQLSPSTKSIAGSIARPGIQMARLGSFRIWWRLLRFTERFSTLGVELERTQFTWPCKDIALSRLMALLWRLRKLAAKRASGARKSDSLWRTLVICWLGMRDSRLSLMQG